jgi:hypothetical protein
MQPIQSGTLPGLGSFRCQTCDYVVTLAGGDELPPCPGCRGTRFVRASLFGGPRFRRRATSAPESEPGGPAWLPEARGRLTAPGEYLAYERAGRAVTFPLTSEWTRVGRSLAADIRFDDPTVSRRHALFVRAPDGVRVLDDRSLNGVFVNGERVEWRALSDGDEILVGAHALHFLEVAPDRPGDPAEPRGSAVRG